MFVSFLAWAGVILVVGVVFLAMVLNLRLVLNLVLVALLRPGGREVPCQKDDDADQEELLGLRENILDHSSTFQEGGGA
jgi:hypothetical protein